MIALLMLLFFLGTFAVVLYLGKKKEKGIIDVDYKVK